MKQLSTALVSKLPQSARKIALYAVAITIAATAPLQVVQLASARNYEAEISAKRQEVERYQSIAADLRQQAASLSNELARLNAERATIQGQIDLSQAKYDKLVADIATNEKKIADNQDVLGDTIANLYVDGDVSTLEMLASSQNISEYVDKQEHRATVRDALVGAIDEIKKLKKELEQQKKDVERVLADQNAQKATLVAKENEQQRLIDQTNGEEAAWQKLSSERTAEISKLQQQQAAELAARARASGGGYVSLPGDGSRGGYPSMWANAPMNSYVDNWGMYTRQCVSYAAFKVQQNYGNMPYWGGIGNANQWDDNARRMGIPLGSQPKVGSVGVVNSGAYGHVAWVESVNADGTINISHYNVGWGGEYAYWANLNPRYFDVYIYFGEW